MTFNFAFLGTGRITQKILGHFKDLKLSKPYLLCGRTEEKTSSIAKEYGVEKWSTSFEDALNDPYVDAIYLALPNDMHAEWAIRALEHKKHLLIEKPMLCSAAAAEQLVALANKHKLLCVEAFMYRHHAQSRELKSLIETGEIGNLRHLSCQFHIPAMPLTDIRMQKDRAGGALGDIGCYVNSMALHLMGTNVKLANVRLQRRLNNAQEIDEFVSWELENSAGVTAKLECSFLGHRSEGLQIYGDRGAVFVERPFKAGSRETLKLIQDRTSREWPVEDSVDSYVSELRHFELALAGKHPQLPSLEESLVQAKILSAIAEGRAYET